MRLIDADKLIGHLYEEIDGCDIPLDGGRDGKNIAYGTALGLKSAIAFAIAMPAVDNKTEVAREIFAEIEKVATINIHTGEIKISAHEYSELRNKYTKEGVGE